jgi:hypothetical protein
MFNVDAKNVSIAVTSIGIDVMNGTAAEVWTKQGSFVGFETNMSNWTKIKGNDLSFFMERHHPSLFFFVCKSDGILFFLS